MDGLTVRMTCGTTRRVGVPALAVATILAWGLGASALGLAAFSSCAAEQVPRAHDERSSRLELARDLRAEASAAHANGQALLVLFSVADCPWCARLRRDYLFPMQKNPDDRRRVVMREIGIDSSEALVDFNGRTTTHAAFARSIGARFSPTVAFFAADGTEAAERLIGYNNPDFYGAYLERRIEAARAARSR